MMDLRFSYLWNTSTSGGSWNTGDAAYQPSSCNDIPDDYLQTVKSQNLNYLVKRLGVKFHIGNLSLISCVANPQVIFKRNSVEIGRIPLTGSENIITNSDGWASGTFSFHVLYDGTPLPPACVENFDCPEGEKCVEGECVPCDDQAATHFQVRFEYEELVTTSDANQVMSTLSSIYPISGSEGQIIQGQETSGLWYYPRIRFCNSAGEAKPYTGALAFYGYCNPDGSTALYSNNRNLTEKPWVIGEKARTDSVSANPWSVPRLLIEFIEQSRIIYEVVCSGATGEEFPPIEPVEPTEPEEPLPPDPGDPPDEIDEPLPPEPVDGTGGGEPPPEPQEGLCDCEKYLAKMILAGTQQIRNAIVEHGNQLDARLADGHSVLYDRITSLERVLYQQHSETNRLLYELSMFLFQPYYSEIVLIRKTLQKSLESGDDGLIDIVKTGLVEEEKGLVDYAKDFVEQYEPVTIENEYRTQSHRVIDNLDEVVTKL